MNSEATTPSVIPQEARLHRLSEYEFDLPMELVAREPVENQGLSRDQSRLLVIHRRRGVLEHRRFCDIVEYLLPGDVLVINDSRVINSLLPGTRDDGARVTLNIFSRCPDGTWHCLVRPPRAARQGLRLTFGKRLSGRLVEQVGARAWRVEFSDPDLLWPVLSELGRPSYSMYIREPRDFEQYQTVYAQNPGSTELPAAGRHFTPELLDRIASQGTAITRLTLHVGVSSLPIEMEDYTQHTMLPEWYEVSPQAAAEINRRRAAGGRVFACGTTCVRTLETATGDDGVVRAGSGWAGLFIYPGFRFKACDAIISNFHQPRSTRLLLVAAFAGRELVLSAYREAVAQRYRFYEFGDTTLMI
ncbi:MAG: tRNA preQ1(34) S-adenosylmethionine ribosyltransferase-isomerase QueA [Acetobacteraceae bacterium]|nr:tRNA preQ1(34) S-adenosylmethionine ribosyltransferase-isomerase QueA [Acetobacteraceae bacterium]